MRKYIIILFLVLGFCFGELTKYYREFSVVDFFETISIYQHYATQRNASVSYGTGASLVVLGLGQSSTDTIITGASYIGLGLLNQLDIIQNDFKKRFEEYRNKIYSVLSIPEMNRVAAESLNDLIKKEKSDNLWNGGMLSFNGALLVLNPDGKGSFAGVLMLLYGGYIAFLEKGPLELMVEEYKILEYDDEDIDTLFENISTRAVLIDESLL